MTINHEADKSKPPGDTGSIRWQTIFNAIGNPAIILDRNHRVVAANCSSVRLTGKRNDEIVGRYCYEVFHHSNSESPAPGCPMEKMLQSGVMESVDMEMEALDGTFLVSCTPVLAPDGSLDKVIHIATDITARKDMELKLLAESTFNRSIIDNAPEGLCVCRAVPEFPYVRFTVWNERMTAITGYTLEEINAGGYYQTLYPDKELQARAVERMGRMRDGDNLVGENWNITNKRGEERVVAIWTSVIHSEDDTNHVLAFFIDVTEHKLIEALHEQSGQDWEDSFQSINDAITILDNDYNIIHANKAAEELLAAPVSYLISNKCHWFFHGLDHPMPGCPTCKTMTGGQPSHCEFFESHLGKYLELKAFPRIGKNGEKTGVIHVARDVTEIKQAEFALKEQQNFAKSLIRNSMAALFVLDSNHMVRVWNNTCENLTGISHTDMIGRDDHWRAFYPAKQPTLADTLLDGDLNRLPELYQHVSKSEHIPNGYKAEGWFEQINGKDRYLMIEASPVYDRQGKMTHVIESINDLTESKTMEEHLLHSQKIESIGHLAGGIAHEFNNILAVILGYGQVMRKGFEPDSTNMNDLDQIMTAAERAAVLTKGLLAFSRKQHVTLKNMDVNVIVHNALKSFSRIIGDDIVISENLDALPLIIYADQALVTQVVVNLISNARDAMPNGGEFKIRTKNIVLTAPYVTPFCSIPVGEYAQISLSDSGLGMDEETMQKIFEPFFTTKDVGMGTGLGLSVVHGIISQHGGYIVVSSTSGQGTTFELYFPLVLQQELNLSVPERHANLRGGNETILLADDESTLLALFSEILSGLGYRVITAKDGVDAVEKFTDNRDDIKLLILDVQMQGKSGLEAFREIKLIKPECPALFISGFNEEQFQGDMTLEENSELLTKPFTPGELAGRIRKMLDADKGHCMSGVTKSVPRG